GHEHIILDPDTTPTCQIRAGLDRKHHPGHDEFVRHRIVHLGPPRRDPWIFVHLDAEAVSRSMAERLAEACVRQGVTSGRIDRESGTTGARDGNRAIMSGSHGAIDLMNAIASPAD